MKKILVFISFILLTTTAIAAEICPTPAELASAKDFKYLGWQALNRDNDTPADPDEVAAFKKDVGNFYLAEWSADYNYGYGRCYYTGDNQLIYIASRNNMPEPPNVSKHSYPWVKRNTVDQCYGSVSRRCIF